MGIYFITIVCILLYGGIFFFGGKSDVRKKGFLICAFGHLMLVMALRAPAVGTDVDNYVRQFIQIGQSNHWMKIINSAPVYNAYNKILYNCFPYKQALIAATAIIICISVAVFIYYFSENVVISTYCYITLFFYFHSFNISRQFIAISLMLLAMCARQKNHKVLMVILSLLAIGIHNTAVIFLPCLVLSMDNMSQKKTNTLLGAFALLAIGLNRSMGIMIHAFVTIFPRYKMYLEGGMHSVMDQGAGNNILLFVFYICVMIVSYVIVARQNHFKIDKKDADRLRFFLVISGISAAVGIAAASNLAFSRMQIYFEIYFICLLPALIERFRKERYLLYLGLVCILMLPFLIQLFKNIDDVVPYRFYWQVLQ